MRCQETPMRIHQYYKIYQCWSKMTLFQAKHSYFCPWGQNLVIWRQLSPRLVQKIIKGILEPFSFKWTISVKANNEKICIKIKLGDALRAEQSGKHWINMIWLLPVTETLSANPASWASFSPSWSDTPFSSSSISFMLSSPFTASFASCLPGLLPTGFFFFLALTFGCILLFFSNSILFLPVKGASFSVLTAHISGSMFSFQVRTPNLNLDTVYSWRGRGRFGTQHKSLHHFNMATPHFPAPTSPSGKIFC